MGSSEWIIFDTDVVRHTLDGDAQHGIDLFELERLRGTRPVSISEIASLELLDDLMSNELHFKQWNTFARRLSPVLDPDFPIIPNGAALSAMLGVGQVDFDIGRQQRIAWKVLESARRHSDLRDGRRLHFEGRMWTFRRSSVRRIHSEVESRWNGLFARMAQAAGGAIRSRDRKSVESAIRGNLSLEIAQVPELETVVRGMGIRFGEYGQGYRPKLNDALDFEHLYMLGLPAIVCTSDRRARNFARSLKTPGSERVLSPSELLDRLRHS